MLWNYALLIKSLRFKRVVDGIDAFTCLACMVQEKITVSYLWQPIVVACEDFEGPFVGGCTCCNFQPDGRSIKQAVSTMGHNMKWSERQDKLTRQWVYLNSRGPNWRDKGFCKICVDSLDWVVVVRVNLDNYKKYVVCVIRYFSNMNSFL